MTSQFKFRASLPASELREKSQKLAHCLAIPSFMARVMVGRGITDERQAIDFMDPSLERDWRNPYEIEDMVKAADMIKDAIKSGKRIVVFGDFDVDGITSTAVMTRAIRELGGIAVPFIPSRFEEGYGLSREALDRASLLKGDLLVTVDCGISCRAEVEYAKQLGLEVVVTDHHERGSSVPEGIPVVDPKAQDDCPSAILAGVGVALKMVQALGNRFGQPHLWRQYTDFATLGTVADLMPLVGENRALVKDGIDRMREQPRPCIAALAAVAGAPLDSITSTALSFSLIPRINAAGRMDNVELALHLMLSDDYEDASYLAEELDSLNARRRSIEADLSEAAMAMARAEYADDRVIVVAGEGWHEGVKGIVASKLSGAFGAPSLLFSIEGDEARGSGRSVGNINLFKAVESQSHLLTKFGGHSAAVGVTLPTANLDAFRRGLSEYMSMLPDEEFVPTCDIDGIVELEELDIESVSCLERLAPFGNDNPEPVLLARNVILQKCVAVGADKTHLSCQLSDGLTSIKGIMFRCREIERLVRSDAVADVAFTVNVEEWRGQRYVKAIIKDISISKTCSGLDGCLDKDFKGYIEGLYEGVSPCVHDESGKGAAPAPREELKRLGCQDRELLRKRILHSLIGEASPHESQLRAMDLLDEGRSVLAVMGTGRGKSLIFQAHAAQVSIMDGKCSLFVYPLRALMADQAFHLQKNFREFGLECRILNGHTSQEERREVYRGIRDGSVDIVLTTPEYLSFHAPEISQDGRIGFVVIDEAHHIGESGAGARPAYRQLKSALEVLEGPQVIAVTATAGPATASVIKEELGIDEMVVDEYARENLSLDDRRDLSSREDYLAHIVATGEKCVIYVNSREQSVELARILRSKVLHLAPLIGFYNAGMSREDRTRIEDLFREGVIRTLVATSAFGEGVDIPDIRHVVLFHMPFSEIEFNQMSGRAGRDGKDAFVHLLFGRQDASINKSLLGRLAPDRDSMAQVYRHLKAMQNKAPGQFLRFDFMTLARDATSPLCILDADIVECGVRVFEELGLIDVERMPNIDSNICSMRVLDVDSKVELTDSLLYKEGADELSSFAAFRNWALKTDALSLRARIIHPISPGSRH